MPVALKNLYNYDPALVYDTYKKEKALLRKRALTNNL